MEIIQNKIQLRNPMDKYFKEDNICLLDIETLGFSRQYHHIYLIGLVYFSKKDQSWILEQLFINSLDKEKELLKILNQKLEGFDLLVTYNGDSFDIPFILERCKKYGLKDNLSPIKSYDIYREIRKNGKYLNLPNLKLKTIERHLGIFREDEFSGGDCIDIYLNYVESKDLQLKKFVLMHNFEDLFYLTDTLRILDKLDDKLKFYIDDKYFRIDSIKTNKNNFQITLNSNYNLDLIYFKDSYKLKKLRPYSYQIQLEYKQAYIEENVLCKYFDMSSLDKYLIDGTSYKLPKNILVLQIGKKENIENIKTLLTHIFSQII